MPTISTCPCSSWAAPFKPAATRRRRRRPTSRRRWRRLVEAADARHRRQGADEGRQVSRRRRAAAGPSGNMSATAPPERPQDAHDVSHFTPARRVVARAARLRWRCSHAGAQTQNDPLGGRPRALVQRRGLPGIDAGCAITTRRSSRPDAARAAWPLVQRADARRRAQLYRRRLGDREVPRRRGHRAPCCRRCARVEARRLERPSYADFEIMTIPADADPEAVAAELARATGRRVRAAALSELPDAAAQRPVLRPAVELPGARHGARVGHPAAGRQRGHRGGARQRRGVPHVDHPLQLALPVPPDAPDGPIFPALGLVDVPFAVAPELGDAKFVVAARLHLGRRRCRSISTGTART